MEVIILKDLINKEESDFNIVKINDIEVPVKKYVPLKDKMSIIGIALQEARDENELIVRGVADACFQLFTIFVYSGITFSPDEKEDILGTYDTLVKNGIIDAVIAAIPEVEYEDLVGMYGNAISSHESYRFSVAYAVEGFFSGLPDMINAMSSGLANFDIEKYNSINDMLKAVGGNESALENTLLGQK